jgi:hypothetical protein
MHSEGNPRVELKSQLFKAKEGTPMVRFGGEVLTRTIQTPDDLAFLLKLPLAAEEAKKHSWRIPTPPPAVAPPTKNTGANLL